MTAYKEYSTLSLLLRYGLWGKEREHAAGCGIPLSETEWEKVVDLARHQTVLGVAFQGLSYLPDAVLPPENIMLRWVAEIDRIERLNRRMNQTVYELFDFFRSQQLHPVLLKGQGIARMYDDPLLRESGDIDLYFPDADEFVRAERALQSRRIPYQKRPDGSMDYLWNNIEVEHHSRLFDLHSPWQKGYIRLLEQTKGFVEQTLTDEITTTVTVPSPMLNILLLNTHILKHAMGKGIGLRQLCDMACACHYLYGQLEADEMKRICRKLGVTAWSRLLHTFLTEELGLTAEKLPYPDRQPDSHALLDIVLAGGNFGHYHAGLQRKMSSVGGRKLYTAFSFLRNIRFSYRYAPKEAFWTVVDLMKGQFIC